MDWYGISTDGAHRALFDCRMNQQVFKRLWEEIRNPSGEARRDKGCPKCGNALKLHSGNTESSGDVPNTRTANIQRTDTDEVRIMDVEQKLIQEIRNHGQVQAIRHLCDDIGNLNKLVAVPIPDGTNHFMPSTFLSLAISCDNLEAVKVLLQKGADPN